MKKDPNFSNSEERAKRPVNKITVILCCVAAVILLALVVMIIMMGNQEEEVITTEPPTAVPTTEPVVVETVAETEPVETEPVMLEEMAALYEQNPDVIGWLRIDDTQLDYPVMFTPEDEEKYLRADFEGNYHTSGLPFIDKDCSMDPESDNIIIYGHNMQNGTAFRTLMSYKDQSFWEEHPTIYFSTLYEERTYEIIAAFYDRVYYKYEDVFKFYQFIDYETEEEFNEAISNYQAKAEYDTGVTAEYGDRLLTLVTCSYHHKYGRFVVVAREVTENSSAEETVPIVETVPETVSETAALTEAVN